MIRPPDYVQEVLKTLEQQKYRAYLVGGCVRDMVMGRTPHDWDVSTDAWPDAVQALFPRTAPTGLRHGTVTVVTAAGHVEVTTMRREGPYTDHRRPEQVAYVSDLTEDLARRDFTMNAMAVSPDDHLVDPFGGASDIAQKIIRCVGDPAARFSEDALRMLRALRFSAKLGFAIHPETLRGIRASAYLAKTLSAERVRDEVEHMLCSNRPEVLADGLELGLLAAYTTDATANRGEINRLGQVSSHRYHRWAAFSAALKQSGTIISPAQFLRALRLDNKTIRVAAHGADLALSEQIPVDAIACKRLLAEYGVDVIRCMAEVAAFFGCEDSLSQLEAVLSSGDCFSLRQLAIDGSDLIALDRSGTEIGQILDGLLDHVLQHPADNQRDVLLAHVRSRGDGLGGRGLGGRGLTGSE